jgi:hypothetical protein
MIRWPFAAAIESASNMEPGAAGVNHAAVLARRLGLLWAANGERTLDDPPLDIWPGVVL